MISRRKFVFGGATVAAGTALAGLAGCSPASQNTTESNIGSEAAAVAENDPWKGAYASEYADRVSETIETDVCIIGAGASGLTAAVEASGSNKRTLVLESQAEIGGNGAFSDGCFTYGSPEMRAACEKHNVTVTPAQLLRGEVEMYDYCVPPLLWLDVINHSADNTKWLQEAGARFAPEVDYYGSFGTSPTFFMWEDGYGTGLTGLIEPLSAKAQENGAEIRVNVRARALKTDEKGKITGLYAEASDGVLEVNAPVVILAGGGWAGSPEMLEEYGGFDMEKCVAYSAAGTIGDTLKMAAAIGARQDAVSRGYMLMSRVNGIKGAAIFSYYPGLWINQNGERFTNEDCGALCNDYQTSSIRGQESVYVILTDAMISDAEGESGEYNSAKGIKDFRAQVESALSDSEKPIYTGDTVNALATAAGIDGKALEETIRAYEEYVAAQDDAAYGKDQRYLTSFAEGPYYAFPVYQEVCLSLGGISTNRNWQVVDQRKQPIEGLYAIGADGEMVYLGFYNLNTSGGFMATNIESGRYSVKHAAEAYL